MKRYFTQFGSYPKIEAAITVAGPQNEDQIPCFSIMGKDSVLICSASYQRTSHEV